jgi:hypothetical protein
VRVRESQRKYIFELRADAPIGPDDIKRLKSKYGADVAIHGGLKPFMALRQRSAERPGGAEKLKEIMAFIAAVVI